MVGETNMLWRVKEQTAQSAEFLVIKEITLVERRKKKYKEIFSPNSTEKANFFQGTTLSTNCGKFLLYGKPIGRNGWLHINSNQNSKISSSNFIRRAVLIETI